MCHLSLLTAGGLDEVTLESPFQPNAVCEPVQVKVCVTLTMRTVLKQLKEYVKQQLRSLNSQLVFFAWKDFHRPEGSEVRTLMTPFLP